MPKIEKNTWISRGFNEKSGIFLGGHGKIDWKSRGVDLKIIDILNMGGTVFFLKKPNSLQTFFTGYKPKDSVSVSIRRGTTSANLSMMVVLYGRRSRTQHRSPG